MKKRIAFVFVLAICMLLCACGTDNPESTISQGNENSRTALEEGAYLYEALGIEHISSIGEDLPTAVHIVIDHMGMQEIADVTDETQITELVEAFQAVKIGKQSNEFTTDNYNLIGFEFADGTNVSLNLNLKSLEIYRNDQWELYELECFDDLWNLMNDLADFPEE